MSKKPLSRRRLRAIRQRGLDLLAARGREHYVELAAKSRAVPRKPKSCGPRLTQLTLHLRADQAAWLIQAAAATKSSRGAILREALDWYWTEWESAREESVRHRRMGRFHAEPGEER